MSIICKITGALCWIIGVFAGYFLSDNVVEIVSVGGGYDDVSGIRVVSFLIVFFGFFVFGSILISLGKILDKVDVLLYALRHREEMSNVTLLKNDSSSKLPYWICKNCGTENKDGSIQCRGCGSYK